MHDRITTQPQIHFGKLCVAGTRVTFQSVLESARDNECYYLRCLED